MSNTNHYHERITRATERLAQLHAKELLANHRLETHAKRKAKQEEQRRRRLLADLIYATGADRLTDLELEQLLIQGINAKRHLPKSPNVGQCVSIRDADSHAT